MGHKSCQIWRYNNSTSIYDRQNGCPAYYSVSQWSKRDLVPPFKFLGSTWFYLRKCSQQTCFFSCGGCYFWRQGFGLLFTNHAWHRSRWNKIFNILKQKCIYPKQCWKLTVSTPYMCIRGKGCLSLVMVGICLLEFKSRHMDRYIIPAFQEKVTHSYTNQPDFRPNPWPKLQYFPEILVQIWENFEKLTNSYTKFYIL